MPLTSQRVVVSTGPISKDASVMHLRRQQVEPTTAPVSAPRVELRLVDGRTDLACLICQHVIAYGVEPTRAAGDDRYYLEQHAPFCMAER
jgi:hypothetical protein